MKQNKLLGLLVLSAGLVLASCGGTSSSETPTPSSTESTSSATSSQTPSSSSSESSEPSSSSSTWTMDTSSGTIIHSDKNFQDALEADYSNMTVAYAMTYDNESMYEVAYEYCLDGYTIVYDQTYAESLGSGYMDRAYLPYYEYEGDWYQYWQKRDGYEHDGWISNGYRDSDLGLNHAYFSINDLIRNISVDDVEYMLGSYFVTAEATRRVFNDCFGFFGGFMTTEEFTAISFILDDEGRISKIFGSVSDNSDDGIEIQLGYFGSTVSPITLPEAPNESNIYTYAEMLGEHYVPDVYIDTVSIGITEGQDYKSDEDFDIILDQDESVDVYFSYTPEDANQLYVNWFSTNEEVASTSYKDNWTSHHKWVSGVNEGTAEIYVTYQQKDGTVISSNRLKVKVNGTPTQDKTNAVYDLKVTGVTDVYSEPENPDSTYLYTSVSAVNNIETEAPFTIKGHNVHSLEAQYTDSFGETGVVLMATPSSQEFMNKGAYSSFEFDFGDQQVCSMNFYYALQRSNQRPNVKNISDAYIQVSNDGDTWSDPIDIKEEMVENFNSINLNYNSNLKIMDRSFPASSHVKLYFKTYNIGGSLNICMNDFVFKHDETCHDHGQAPVVDVTSVGIAASASSIKVGKTTQFSVSSILPENATNKNVTWHSANETVLTIDSKTGLATGVAAGTAEVYATSSNGVESNRVTITVIGQEYLPDSMLGVYLLDEYYYESKWYDLKINISNTTGASVGVKADGEDEIVMEFPYDTYDAENRQYVFKTAGNSTLRLKAVEGGLEVFLDSSLITLGNKFTGEGDRFTKYVAATAIVVKHDDAAIESVSLVEGDNYEVTATVAPSNSYYKAITVTSEDASIATVEDGQYYGYVIKAVAAGTTNIVFTNADGVEKKVAVTVTAPVLASTINVTASSSSLAAGDKLNLNVEVLPANTSKVNLVYSSSNERVATVNNKGVVSGIAEGEVTITVTDIISGVSGTINLTVTSGNAVAADFVGEWSGYDVAGTEFTLTINADGTAVLNDGETDYGFTLTDSGSGNYTFVSDDDSDCTFIIYGSSTTEKTIEVEDGNSLIEMLYLYGPLPVEKA